MLYVFHGQAFWINKKLAELENKAREKACDVLRFEGEVGQPLNVFLSKDLFGKKIFLILKGLLENDDVSTEIKALAQDFAGSENIIAIIEDKLDEKWEKLLEKDGAKIQEFKKASGPKLLAWMAEETKVRGIKISKRDADIIIDQTGGDPFSILNKLERISLEKNFEAPALKNRGEAGNYFNFADAVSSKRKGQALALLRSYIKEGLGAEEAYWKLWWKIKTLRMVDSGKRGTGLHPFVEKKALQDLQNYSSKELKKLSMDLLDIFSDTRRGEESFEEGLEKIILRG